MAVTEHGQFFQFMWIWIHAWRIAYVSEKEKGAHQKGRVHRVNMRPAPGPNSVIVMQWSQELLPLLQVWVSASCRHPLPPLGGRHGHRGFVPRLTPVLSHPSVTVTQRHLSRSLINRHLNSTCTVTMSKLCPPLRHSYKSSHC